MHIFDKIEFSKILSFFILLLCLTNHPFIFSIALSDTIRFSVILAVFFLISVCLVYVKFKQSLILFFLVTASLLVLLNFQNVPEINRYVLYILRLAFFFLIWLVISGDFEFCIFLKKIFIILGFCLALLSFVGFGLVNLGLVTTQNEVSLYGLFGLPTEGDGYVYSYHPLLGFFANTGLLNLGVKRSVGVTFEPNSTGVVIMLALLLLSENKLFLKRKNLISLILILGGICTISLLFLLSLAIFLYLKFSKNTSSALLKFVINVGFLLLGSTLMVGFLIEIFMTSSGLIRLSSLLKIYDFYISQFDLIDVFFGRGLGFSKSELGFGIDSGYVAIACELGILIFGTLIFLVWSMVKSSEYSKFIIFIFPLSVNLQFSFIFLLFCALLFRKKL